MIIIVDSLFLNVVYWKKIFLLFQNLYVFVVPSIHVMILREGLLISWKNKALCFFSAIENREYQKLICFWLHILEEQCYLTSLCHFIYETPLYFLLFVFASCLLPEEQFSFFFPLIFICIYVLVLSHIQYLRFFHSNVRGFFFKF